ncbi:hypothetical protein ACMBCN_01715 [Candidatus Liberibacter asiaticus]|nr:hypothetical protein [Candidatus Liberibacter asiaticus]
MGKKTSSKPIVVSRFKLLLLDVSSSSFLSRMYIRLYLSMNINLNMFG